MEKTPNNNKVRIQLFDDEWRLLSDRLVTQQTELYQGPKEIHKGPMKMEFTVENTDDVDRLVIYLQKLKGEVPLAKKGTPGRKKTSTKQNPEFVDSQREELINKILNSKRADNQNEFLEELRKYDFRLVSSQYADDLGLTIGPHKKYPLGIKPVFYKNYDWFLRTVRLAKDPMNDKYDPLLAIGVKIHKKRSDKVLIYLNRTLHGKHIIPVPDKPKITFKKSELSIFPKYMTIEERVKWRRIRRQVLDGKLKEEDAPLFYRQCKKDIKLAPGK